MPKIAAKIVSLCKVLYDSRSITLQSLLINMRSVKERSAYLEPVHDLASLCICDPCADVDGNLQSGDAHGMHVMQGSCLAMLHA
jgi:hypothetical protein